MNKSLVFKNKLYLFLSFLFFLFIFLYLLYFILNAERGIIAYYKLKNEQLDLKTKLSKIENKNDFLINRVARLKINSLDLDYLEEQLRINTGYLAKNEIIVSLEE